MDFLKSAVSSAISKGPPFPYTFGDKVSLDQSIWSLFNGLKREDNSNCSIFTFDSQKHRSCLPLAQNAVRKMRTLRHPGVIKVLDTVETESYIYVATERVVPLEWPSRRHSLSVETLKWGLYTVANTLSFINDEASSIHGNIRLSSVFISPSGEWRLGGFEVLSALKDNDAIFFTHGSLIPESERYAPPEIVKSGWDTAKRHPISAVDSYGLGLLIFEVFNGCLIGNDQTGQVKNIPPSMQQSYKRLFNANPKARLSVTHFRDQGRRSGGFFETPLIRLSEGIESLGLKSDGEKEEFIGELEEVADDFPEDFFSVKVLPELLKSVEFGGGGPKVFSSVMKIGSKISDEEYDLKITPVIIRLFSNPDRGIRVCLLDNLPHMIEHFSQKIVNDKIFPQMVTGFTDLAPLVREQTVKSVLTVISKLSDRVINGELLKQLAKTSNDEQPGIRTNTTICLGKIARNLGANTRQKVLSAAFTRSLRDPFIHARNAALQALAATCDLFSEDDCAHKIMPALCPLLIDKEKLVRDQANKTFEIYLQRVRKHGNSLPDSALPASSVASANGTVPRIGTSQNDTSWAGWAISSFTNKIATASGEMQSKPSVAPVQNRSGGGWPSSVSTVIEKTLPSNPTTSPMSHQQTPSGTSSAPVLTRTSTDQISNDPHNEADMFGDIDEAWGDMNGDTFFDSPSKPEPEPEPAPAPIITFDDGGEPDFEGWLKAQAQSKTKPPLPKGLKRSANPTPSRPPAAGGFRTTTTGMLGPGAAVKQLANAPAKPGTVTSKSINTKPNDAAGDDDWGDAWD